MTPRHPTALRHRQWMALATEEYRRLVDLTAGLAEDDWSAPTDCADWSVRDIVAHLVGAAEAGASMREQLRQQRIGAADKAAGLQIDAVNRLQIAERATLSPDDLVAALADAGRRGVAGRRRTPSLIRAIKVRLPAPVGWASIGFVGDAVYTRDAWMHRVDICRAAGAPLELTQDHDALIIADAARAWLRLTGTRGVHLTGEGAVTMTLGEPDAGMSECDAVDFARALSGRGEIAGVRADLVLF